MPATPAQPALPSAPQPATPAPRASVAASEAGTAGGRGASIPSSVPHLVEIDDPTGDTRAGVLDIIHLAAWVAGDSLRVQVTLDGAPPSPADAAAGPWAAVRVSVFRAGRAYDLPVCNIPTCGSHFTIPPFSADVVQGTGRWVVEGSVRLADIPGPRPSDSLQVVAISSYGTVGVGSVDFAPSTGRLTVPLGSGAATPASPSATSGRGGSADSAP